MTDGDVWKARRRVIVPALHKKYVASMVDMFGDCTLHGVNKLQQASARGEAVEMENFFSRLALDVIGKAVFNYEFDSLTTDDPVIKVGDLCAVTFLNSRTKGIHTMVASPGGVYHAARGRVPLHVPHPLLELSAIALDRTSSAGLHRRPRHRQRHT